MASRELSFTWWIEDSIVHLKPVQVGVTTEPIADILSGISDGDRVVVDGPTG